VSSSTRGADVKGGFYPEQTLTDDAPMAGLQDKASLRPMGFDIVDLYRHAEHRLETRQKCVEMRDVGRDVRGPGRTARGGSLQGRGRLIRPAPENEARF